VIDEWYDRAFLEARVDLQLGVERLLARLSRLASHVRRPAQRKTATSEKGDHPCTPNSSLFSPPCH
jgi:hypothetical protein